jgi:hypothetical protein
MNHDLDMESNSDCMTIPLLYLKHTKFNPYESTDILFFAELFKTDIKGEFAFLLFEFEIFNLSIFYYVYSILY